MHLFDYVQCSLRRNDTLGIANMALKDMTVLNTVSQNPSAIQVDENQWEGKGLGCKCADESPAEDVIRVWKDLEK